MIDGIVSGRIFGKPGQRTSKTGTPFVRLKIRIPTQDGSAMFASAVCFSVSMSEQLLALDEGDSVSLAGSITIKPWLNNGGEPCANVDMVVHGVLTAYHVTRKKGVMQMGKSDTKSPSPSPTRASGKPVAFADFEDDVL